MALRLVEAWAQAADLKPINAINVGAINANRAAFARITGPLYPIALDLAARINEMRNGIGQLIAWAPVSIPVPVYMHGVDEWAEYADCIMRMSREQAPEEVETRDVRLAAMEMQYQMLQVALTAIRAVGK